MKRLVTLVAGTAVTLLGLIAAQPALATLPGSNGRIAFSTDVRSELGLGSSQIYTIRPNGTGLIQLTHVPDGVDAHRAAWSPDGRTLLFHRVKGQTEEIWIMDRDGTGQHQLVHDPGHVNFDAAWSPDGSEIAFSRCPVPFGPCGIAVADADGTGIKTLVGGNWFAGTPRYSPNGNRIVFDSDRGGFLDALWTVNRETGHLRRITPPSLEAFYPDWSPDGTRIVFTDNCCRPQSNVWTVRPDGSGLTQLTDFPAGHQGGFARYSPDGTKIVLASDLRYPEACCFDVYVMNADGTNLHPITRHRPYVLFADWGPRVTSYPRAIS